MRFPFAPPQTGQYLPRLGLSHRELHSLYSGKRHADHAYELAVWRTIRHDHERYHLPLGLRLMAPGPDRVHREHSRAVGQTPGHHLSIDLRATSVGLGPHAT